MLTDLLKFPAPYYGGKQLAAPAVWAALGDVEHFCEPFCGTCAVLLRRPHECNRTYHSETVNDADGLLVNALRGIQLHPEATADAASRFVAEADLHAIHGALIRWKAEQELEHLMGDPAFCDPQMAGWFLWGMSCWIGSGWCSGKGPWIVNADGRLTRREKDEPEPGVNRQLPHISDDGMGVNHSGTREPGVNRQRPHLGDDGMGVNHAGTREPGVNRQRPHLSGDGMGVNHSGTREPGVWADDDFHEMTMPELRRWFLFLSARLRHVRILNGDWHRAVTNGATKILSVRQGDGHCGVFLDPPYADTANRAAGLYAHDSLTVAHDAREWAIANGNQPWLRIVFAGYEAEHSDHFARAGWREVEWFKAGHLTGGYGNLGGGDGGSTSQQNRERLWLSPHCLTDTPPPVAQLALWDEED